MKKKRSKVSHVVKKSKTSKVKNKPTKRNVRQDKQKVKESK